MDSGRHVGCISKLFLFAMCVAVLYVMDFFQSIYIHTQTHRDTGLCQPCHKSKVDLKPVWILQYNENNPTSVP